MNITSNAELADFLIEKLNAIGGCDPEAMASLVDNRVPCNDTLANHPTVMVSSDGKNPPNVGMLGLLNGIVGTIEEGPKKGFGHIAAVYEGDNDDEFTGFIRTDAPTVSVAPTE